jgi:hypothetical protein
MTTLWLHCTYLNFSFPGDRRAIIRRFVSISFLSKGISDTMKVILSLRILHSVMEYSASRYNKYSVMTWTHESLAERAFSCLYHIISYERVSFLLNGRVDGRPRKVRLIDWWRLGWSYMALIGGLNWAVIQTGLQWRIFCASGIAWYGVGRARGC